MGGKTVMLRPLRLSDARALAAWAMDREFCRVAGWDASRSRAEYQRFHERLVMDPPPDLLRLAVTYGGELVGYVDLHGDEPGRRELGFVVGGSSRWGRGLGRVVAAAGLDYGFATVGLDVIWAEAYDAHAHSISVLTRIGMRETGRGEDGEFLGEPTFYRRFELDRASWRASSSTSH